MLSASGTAALIRADSLFSIIIFSPFYLSYFLFFVFFARCDYENGVKTERDCKLSIVVAAAGELHSAMELELRWRHDLVTALRIEFYDLWSSVWGSFLERHGFSVFGVLESKSKSKRSHDRSVAMSLTVFCGRLRKQVGAH